MLTLNLKRKLLISIGMALLCVILLLSAFAYRSLREQVIDGNYEQIARLSAYDANAISIWLKGKEDALAALFNSGKYLDPETLALLCKSSDFVGLYHGDNQGKMIDDDPANNAEAYKDYHPQQESWFKAGLGHDTPVLTTPYLDETYTPAEIVLSVVQATPTGVLGGDITTQRIQQILAESKLPAKGFTLLVDETGNIIAYQDLKRVLKPLAELIPGVDGNSVTSLLNQQEPLEVVMAGEEKLLWARPIANSRWALISVVDKNTLLAPLHKQLRNQIIISLSVLLISLLGIGALISALIAPLRKVSGALAHISSGEGDLTQRIAINNQDEVGELAGNFNRFVGTLHELISRIRQEANEMGESANQGLAQAENSQKEIARQEQEITQVATAVTQMASATQEIAQHAEQTAAAAQSSSQSTIAGSRLVDQTRNSITLLAGEVEQATKVIDELNNHAQAISGVITTIQGVAEQTNLLALNAAIEAARAGEQGRGFAVVADEVRVLSHRTQSATSEIQGTINTLQQSTAAAVAMMQKSREQAEQSVEDADAASAALGEITAAIQVISDMSTQIATAAEEQHKVTDEITRNIHEIKDLADTLTQDASDSAALARSQQEQAHTLNQQVAKFRL